MASLIDITKRMKSMMLSAFNFSFLIEEIIIIPN